MTSTSSTEPTRNDVLAMVAEAIYGADWVSPLARRLGVSVRTAQRWKSRQTEAPQSALDALRELAIDSSLEHVWQGIRLQAWLDEGRLIDLEEAASRELQRQGEVDRLWWLFDTTVRMIVEMRQPIPGCDATIRAVVDRLRRDDPELLAAALSYDDDLRQYLPADYVPVAVDMSKYTTDATPERYQPQLDDDQG